MPATHAMHSELLSSVDLPYPGAQTQAVLGIDPAVLPTAVAYPAPHGVHAVAPFAEKVPTGQKVDFTAALVASESSELAAYDPARTCWQDSSPPAFQ